MRTDLLIAVFYNWVLHHSETFIEPYRGGRYPLGSDLAYVLGGIANDNPMQFRPSDSIAKLLKDHPLPANLQPVRKYIKVSTGNP